MNDIPINENLRFKPVKSIILEEGQIGDYIGILTSLIKSSRASKFYPDPFRMVNLMEFLTPDKNRGLYDRLLINFNTGFPVEKDVTGIITDRQIALNTIGKEDESALESELKKNPSPVNRKRLEQFRYYRDLASADIPELFSIDLRLRSLDTEKYTAYFNVIIDRFDPVSSLFARYTLVVGQEDANWGKTQVLTQGDELKYTRNFRNLLSRYTVDEAEFAFILLNDLENVVVEEVQRCRIGPLYFRGVAIPEGMEEIFQRNPGAFILSLPSDRASISLKEDRNLDPLSRMYREVLDPEARELRDQKAEQIGYHVCRERKFVCSRSMLKDFSEFLKKRQARCVVYGV